VSKLIDIDTVISETDIPEAITRNLIKWIIQKEDNQFIYLSAYKEIINPTGKPYFLVIDKINEKGTLIFKGYIEWDNLKLDEISIKD
jgi:hypothetical protein